METNPMERDQVSKASFHRACHGSSQSGRRSRFSLDTTELKRLTARIRNILEMHQGGSTSPHVLRTLSMVTLQMKIAAGPGHVLEKLASLERCLTILYSPRKHRRIPGGIDQVRR